MDPNNNQNTYNPQYNTQPDQPEPSNQIAEPVTPIIQNNDQQNSQFAANVSQSVSQVPSQNPVAPFQTPQDQVDTTFDTPVGVMPTAQMPPLTQSVEPQPETYMPPRDNSTAFTSPAVTDQNVPIVPPVPPVPVAGDESKKLSVTNMLLLLAAFVLVFVLGYFVYVKMTTPSNVVDTILPVATEIPTEMPIATEVPVIVEQASPSAMPASDSPDIIPTTSATPASTP